MRLTEQQMFEYINCPAKYHIKHIMGINIDEHMSLQKLLNTMSRYFFINLLNGKVLTYDDLKKKWDSLCDQHSHFIDNKKALAGWGSIVQFAQWAERERIIIGDVEAEYNIPVGNVLFVGNIEAITVKQDRTIELLTVSFSEKHIDKSFTEMRLKHLMDYVGFKTLYRTEPDGIRVHSVKFGEDIRLYKTKDEVKRFEDTVLGVANSIRQEIFYPRESNFCLSCTARDYCKRWHK